MLCLSGFELYSRWLPLKIKCIKVVCMWYYRQYYFGTNKSSIESGNNPRSWINNLSGWKRTCKNLGFSKNRILTFERPGTMLYPLSLWSQLETRPSCNWCCKDQGSSSSQTWIFLFFIFCQLRGSFQLSLFFMRSSKYE